MFEMPVAGDADPVESGRVRDGPCRGGFMWGGVVRRAPGGRPDRLVMAVVDRCGVCAHDRCRSTLAGSGYGGLMRRFGALTVAVVMVVAGCSGSEETAPESIEVVEIIEDDGAFRLADGDGQVINGCRIGPGTACFGANLAEANLAAVNLAESRLVGTSLWGADLKTASLSQASLVWVNLAFANLEGANLTDADLRWANLLQAKVSDADLSGVKYCRTIMPDGLIRDDDC